MFVPYHITKINNSSESSCAGSEDPGSSVPGAHSESQVSNVYLALL